MAAPPDTTVCPESRDLSHRQKLSNKVWYLTKTDLLNMVTHQLRSGKYDIYPSLTW